jgi:hypothetical protein
MCGILSIVGIQTNTELFWISQALGLTFQQLNFFQFLLNQVKTTHIVID